MLRLLLGWCVAMHGSCRFQVAPSTAYGPARACCTYRTLRYRWHSVKCFRVLKPGGVAFFSLSEGEPSGHVPVSDLGLATRAYYYHRDDEWVSLVSRAGFEIADHRVNRAAGNFNPGSTGWIETYARKP